MYNLKNKLKYLKNPFKAIIPLADRGMFNWLSDEPYLKLAYWSKTGKRLNLENPKEYNEKLQWLKINDRKSVYSEYVDKYAVREHIAKKIGKKYLIPLIGVYDSVDDIEWDKLPNSFVLKCTHGSSCNIICKNKTTLDIEESKLKLNKWMKKNWYWFGREWPYKDVTPRIICEEFITKDNTIPEDYKIMCFNGKPKYIQIHRDRFGTDYTQDFYDLDGNLMPFNNIGYKNSDIKKLNIKDFSEMLELASKLCKDTYQLRVDFYRVEGKIYFGELTFFDASGFAEFEPEEYNYIVGNGIALPIK